MSAAVASSPANEIASSTARRKSGRVSKRPERFAPGTSPVGSTKRKRGDDNDSGVDADGASSDEESEESSEGEPDDEEVRERQRKRKSRTAARKHATKKPKTNGASVSLAIRPAANAQKKVSKRPRKAPVRKSTLPEATEGLYADVFASGDRLEDVTARWIARFNEHEARAVAEVINLVLRAAGCDITINEDDVADPDNAPNRVAEMQEEFSAEDITEYPLIAKAKDGGGQAFKNALQGFFQTLVQTAAQSGMIYDNPELIENISVWLGAMSSTGNRPFRHTSTVASLAITTALAQVAADIVENMAKRIRQSEAESRKSRVNKARVSAADKEIEDYNQKLQVVESALDDWFSVVYVHRYRDVDPKVRIDCVAALTDWIITYPDKFFDGTKLRYLGWILSDPNPPTRVEVLHQLARLYRDEDKLAGLKTFTEKFRERMVEIATRDAENHVRAAAVDLLDILREAGFLEPDDIDSVGKLIFDSDAKVRRSVVGFFAENVNAVYESLVEDMGGEEALNEALAPPEEDEEEYHNPRLEWLRLKCLVDQLLSYDEDVVELPSQIERLSASGAELGLVASGVVSRRSLAAQALYDAIPEIRSWEVLAGYLLYDHSQAVENGAGDDAETLLRQNCQLEEKHETVLLDVLNAAVHLRLQHLAEAQKDKRKTKAQRESDREDQADMARRLSLLIPQLLKKFGALPEAAALCLRLERELNLDIFEELRQNAALTALLDDINKQFLTHHSERVLMEAVGSIMHAQGNEELKETVDLKIMAIWDDLLNTFDALRRGKDFSKRGNFDHNILVGISNVVLKMSQISKASDTAVLDHVTAPAKSKGRAKKTALNTPPIDALLQILDRGVLDEELDEEISEAEDMLVSHTIDLMLAYFMWKCRDLATHLSENTSMPDDELTALAECRDTCITSLMRIMSTRKGADDLRLKATNLLLDIYTMFSILRAKQSTSSTNPSTPHKTPRKAQGSASSTTADNDWHALCRSLDTPTTKLILTILNAHETHLASLLHKRLEEPDVDDDPVDPDELPDSPTASESDETQITALLAEHNLCALGGRLVQGVLVGALDENLVRKRLERNKAKLTGTWKEVVGHLDVAKSRNKKAKSKTRDQEHEKPNEAKKVVVVDITDDEQQADEEEEDDDDDDDEIQDDEDQNQDQDHEMGGLHPEAQNQEHHPDTANGEQQQADPEHEDEESILGD
ncbi:cohesin complex subunit [Coniothyrium glycines]